MSQIRGVFDPEGVGRNVAKVDLKWLRLKYRNIMTISLQLRITCSWRCAPGPGFELLSVGILNLEAIEKTGGFLTIDSNFAS